MATKAVIKEVIKEESKILKRAFITSLPILAGYLVLGIPCGLLGDRAGMGLVQIVLMSLLFYSGAGQYMVANMWLSATPITSIVLSVSLVNTRQLLYAASLSRFCQQAGRRLSLLFAATVTDESFGVNLARFEAADSWSVREATLVNLFSLGSWTVANVLGAVLGTLLSVPTALAAFAMTSIFICLLFMQRFDAPKVVAAIAAVAGVLICKLVGLDGPAILIGALVGVACALLLGSGGRALSEGGGTNGDAASRGQARGDAESAGSRSGEHTGEQL